MGNLKKKKTIIINRDRKAYIAEVEVDIEGATLVLVDILKLGMKVDGGVTIPLKPEQEAVLLRDTNILDYI